MHEVDQQTEQMVRSVLAYAENRLRMDPVPLDKGLLPAEELYDRLDGLIRDTPRQPDEVLGVYTSVIAPSVRLYGEPSLTLAAPLMAMVGATLLTVIWKVLMSLPESSSFNVTETV